MDYSETAADTVGVGADIAAAAVAAAVDTGQAAAVLAESLDHETSSACAACAVQRATVHGMQSQRIPLLLLAPVGFLEQ